MSGPVAIHTLTIDSTDALAAARFWRDLLDYAIRANHTTPIHLYDPDGDGPDLLFAWTDDCKVAKNRIHLDLRPDDQHATVQRLTAITPRRTMREP